MYLLYHKNEVPKCRLSTFQKYLDQERSIIKSPPSDPIFTSARHRSRSRWRPERQEDRICPESGGVVILLGGEKKRKLQELVLIIWGVSKIETNTFTITANLTNKNFFGGHDSSTVKRKDEKNNYLPGPSKGCQMLPQGCQLTIP